MCVTVGIAVTMGSVILILALRNRILKSCVRQASRDMEEILESPQENCILRISKSSREMELLLERILHNLVQNALRYARSRFGISVRKAGPEEGEHRVFLEFCNDTDSLTQADIPFLFERFYTADHARPSGSTGLGLTVCKLLVQAMEGTARAELTEQGDLCLTFMLNPS